MLKTNSNNKNIVFIPNGHSDVELFPVNGNILVLMNWPTLHKLREQMTAMIQTITFSAKYKTH